MCNFGSCLSPRHPEDTGRNVAVAKKENQDLQLVESLRKLDVLPVEIVVGESTALAQVKMMGVSDPPTDASLQANMEDPPITASLGPIDRLICRLKSLEGSKHTLPMGIRVDQIGKLREHLQEFRKPLLNLSGMGETSFRAKWWMKEVRELCYDTEDYLVQSSAGVHRTLGRIARIIISWIHTKLKLRTRLSKFMARAEILKKTGEKIIDVEIKAAISLETEIKSDISLEKENKADIETLTANLVHMLAFEDDKQTQLKLVAISGFEGSGKTTLARTLYVKCKRKFRFSAFVRVSRNPDFRSLLASILSQIKAPSPHGLCDVQGLICSISDHLQGKRYFIVIDDVRSPSVWDIISRAFPGGNFRSRIIVTTQSEQVEAAYSGYKMESAIFKMGATDDGCTNTTTKGKSNVLNIRYNNLPLHLKTCLLYFSMYPEGSTITKDDLAKRWVGEGFIAALERHRIKEISEVSQIKTEDIAEISQGEREEIAQVSQDQSEEALEIYQKETEKLAHGYFDELVARGMIQPVDRNHKGEVLSCTVHHMVLDLIRYKCKEENFIVVVDNLESTLGHSDIVRRLSVQFGCEKVASIPESIILSQVRSLAFYGFLECVPPIADYGLLQVLNLHIWDDEDKIFDITSIGKLCHLIHLRIESNVTVRLPSKIQRLQHLSTLELHAEVIAIPSDVGHLKKLMHLRCPSMTDVRDLGDLTSLLDLQLTCSNVENLEERMKCLHSILEKVSSLRCLALVPASGSCSVNELPANPSTLCISCDSLCIVSSAPAHLQRLELSRHCCIFSRLPEWIGKLQELCILKIAVRELSRDDIDVLKGLPALTTLSLHLQTKAAEMIVFGKGGFSVLRYFKFTCAVPWLKIEAGAMTNLENLKLCFNAPIVSEKGTSSIIIERLLGLKEVSAIIGCAGVDACSASAAQKAFKNDTGNPEVQFMGSIYYDRGIETHEGSGEDENSEADIRVHMQPESSRLPVPACHREVEPDDQHFVSEISSIPNESECTDLHIGQVVMDGKQLSGSIGPGRAHAGGSRHSGDGGGLTQLGGGEAYDGGSFRGWRDALLSLVLGAFSVVKSPQGPLITAWLAELEGTPREVNAYIYVSGFTDPEKTAENISTRLSDVLENPWILKAGIDKFSDPCELTDESTMSWVKKLKTTAEFVISSKRELHEQNTELCEEAREKCLDQLLEVAYSFSDAGWSVAQIFHQLTIFDALVHVLFNIQDFRFNRSCEAAGILNKMLTAFKGLLQGTSNDMDMKSESTIDPATIILIQVLEFFSRNRVMVQSILESGNCNIDPCSEMLNSWLCKLRESAELKFLEEKGLRYIFIMNNTHYAMGSIRPPGLLLPDVVSNLSSLIHQYTKSYLDECWLPPMLLYLDGDSLKKPRRSSLDNFWEELFSIVDRQMRWKVHAAELKHILRKNIVDLIVPKYVIFSKTLQANTSVPWKSLLKGTSGKRSEKPVYTAAQLEEVIGELFER